MLKITSVLLLGALQIGSLEPYANALSLQKSRQAISNPGFGCACPCGVHTATFRTWQQKDGPVDRFTVNAIGKWFHGLTRLYTDIGASHSAESPEVRRTDLLILLGPLPKRRLEPGSSGDRRRRNLRRSGLHNDRGETRHLSGAQGIRYPPKAQ